MISGLMGASTALVENNYRYTQIMLVSNIVIMLLFMKDLNSKNIGDNIQIS